MADPLEFLLRHPALLMRAWFFRIAVADLGLVPPFDRDDLALLFPRALDVIDEFERIARTLAARGLTPGRLHDLYMELVEAEHLHENPDCTPSRLFGDPHRCEHRPCSRRGKEIVVELWLRGLDFDAIDRYAALVPGGLPLLRPGDARRVLEATKSPLSGRRSTASLPDWERCREIVQLHSLGHPHSAVARRSRSSLETVRGVLSLIGETPHVDAKRVEGHRAQKTLADLLAAHPKGSFKEIAALYRKSVGKELRLPQYQYARKRFHHGGRDPRSRS